MMTGLRAQCPPYGPPGSVSSRPQALTLQILIEVGDVFAVAVEQQRRAALTGPDHLLGGLAPARMGDLWIDVRPEAVFGRLQGFPEGFRTLIRKRHLRDRL